MARNRLTAIVLQRCPVCLDGKVFHSFLGMPRNCPTCGLVYARETGYFLNAMFFAYAMGFVIVAPAALYLYFLGVGEVTFLTVISVILLLLWPLVFRYSRVLWLHVDQLIDPRQPPAAEPEAEGEEQARETAAGHGS